MSLGLVARRSRPVLILRRIELEKCEHFGEQVLLVVAQLEFFEIGKLWETFERSEANIDQTQGLEIGELVCETHNACAAAVVQV